MLYCPSSNVYCPRVCEHRTKLPSALDNRRQKKQRLTNVRLAVISLIRITPKLNILLWFPT